VAPKQHLAVLYGVTGAAGTMMGVLSQPLVGRMVDSIGYKPMFLAAGGIFMLAIILLLSAGKIERLEAV
jgi:MFS family permease